MSLPLGTDLIAQLRTRTARGIEYRQFCYVNRPLRASVAASARALTFFSLSRAPFRALTWLCDSASTVCAELVPAFSAAVFNGSRSCPVPDRLARRRAISSSISSGRGSRRANDGLSQRGK
jgi:hypothetical protein